ncbi:hypothetical protein DFJ74DRAFT_666963 [Hyaloraphidium curvatum]|nr:hypothetical protein DFJ74DRAFT_666963 [Hyaloraphidium curvatum]
MRTGANLRFMLALTLLVVAAGFVAANGVEEPSPDRPDLVCSDGASAICYERMVKPNTHDFVPVLPGQIVDSSAPVHVRMNMETGIKEVKQLGDPEDSSTRGAAPGEVVVSPPQEVLPFGAADTEGSGAPPPSVSFHANDTAAGQSRPKLSVEERLAFEGFYESVLNWKSEELLSLLEDLEDTVHHVDYGHQFASSSGGLEKLLQLLDTHNDSTVRGQAAIVLGSCFSNNPAAQVSATDSPVGVVRSIVATILKEKDEQVLKRVLYAVGVLLRGNPRGIEQFLEHGGLKALAGAVDLDGNMGPVGQRAFALLADLAEAAVIDRAETAQLCEKLRLLPAAKKVPELEQRLARVCNESSEAGL